MDLAQNV